MTPMVPNLKSLNLDSATIQYLIDLGKRLAGPQQAVGANVPVFFDANGDPKAMPELVFNDNEQKLKRIEQVVTVNDPVSFINYYKIFARQSSRTFADIRNRTVTTVIDYHEVGTPQHGTHKLILNMLHSDPWKVWFDANNKKFSQMEFAEFLEQNACDIINPKPAAIKDVADSLEATTEVQFGAGVRTKDGQIRFRYTEETKATVGGSQLDVPEQFTLELPVFAGGPEVKIDCLLRFRVDRSSGKLTFFYTMIRPEEAVRQAFNDGRQEIETGIGSTIINGTVA